MASRRKLWGLSISGVGVAAILLLAAGLSGLELQAAPPRARVPLPATDLALADLPTGDTLPFVVWRVLSILLVVLFPFSIIRFLISPHMRRRVLRDFALIVFLLLLNYLVARAVGQAGLFGDAQPAPGETATEALTVEGRDPPVNPPEWLSLAVSLVLILLLVGIGWKLWRRFHSGRSPLEQLAREAQAAVTELRAGRDLKNVVIRCYADMCRVLSEQRGIRRQPAMTPREFEARLTAAGLPREDVLRLTRLFEGVRYGSRLPGEAEEREALACLSAIAEACARLA